MDFQVFVVFLCLQAYNPLGDDHCWQECNLENQG